jgi:hypothetical protein
MNDAIEIIKAGLIFITIISLPVLVIVVLGRGKKG